MYTKEELFEIINCVNSDAFTPLHLASSEGHPHLIEILVQFGAQIDARNNNFRTPLHIACLRGHLTVIKALVTAGADINAKDIDNNTPTHFCSEYGHSFCLKFILTKEPYLFDSNNEGKSPIDVANSSDILQVSFFLVFIFILGFLRFYQHFKKFKSIENCNIISFK